MAGNCRPARRLTSTEGSRWRLGNGLWFVALLCLLTSAPTSAHVAFPTAYSGRTTISLGADGLKVLVTIEIPLAALVLEFNRHFADTDLIAEIENGRIEELEEQFREAQFERLAENLELEVGERRAPGRWRAADTPINGRGAEGFFVYLLEFEHDSPPELGDRVEIRVGNGLYVGQEMMFANLVEASEPWQLVESSSPQPPPGADLSPGSADETALWSDLPERREFHVVAQRIDSR